VSEFEILMVKQALHKTHYHQKKAAKLLGLTYHQFRGLYRKYYREIKKD